MSKPTVAELLARIEQHEAHIATLNRAVEDLERKLEVKTSTTTSLLPQQRATRRYVDDAELEARRARMAAAKAAAIASGHAVKV